MISLTKSKRPSESMLRLKTKKINAASNEKILSFAGSWRELDATAFKELTTELDVRRKKGSRKRN